MIVTPYGLNMAQKHDNDFVSPVDGGCWFTFRKYEEMVFDGEFDTYVYLPALRIAYVFAKLRLALEPGYQCESLIMEYLLKDDEGVLPSLEDMIEQITKEAYINARENKIETIRVYKHLTDRGLAICKNAVDRYVSKWGPLPRKK